MIRKLWNEVEKVELRIVQKAQESNGLTCAEWIAAFVVGGFIVWLVGR